MTSAFVAGVLFVPEETATITRTALDKDNRCTERTTLLPTYNIRQDMEVVSPFLTFKAIANPNEFLRHPSSPFFQSLQSLGIAFAFPSFHSQ